MSFVLLLAAVIVFVLAAFGVSFEKVEIIAIGLALFAASFLVPGVMKLANRVGD